MRLAFITPEFVTEDSYSGGLANYLGRVTVALAAAGHDVHVFTKSTVNETLIHAGVTVHRTVPLWDLKMRIDRIDRLTPRALYSPYQDLKAAFSLWRRWKKRQAEQSFDVVQVANVLAVGLFFRFVRRVPVVTRLSSYRPAWDEAAGIPLTLSVRLRWWMEKVAIRGTRYLYAPTDYVARLTAENYGIADIRVIETPFFHESPEPDDSLYNDVGRGRRYILFFGRMTQMKGVHLLAQALPGLLAQFPDVHAVLVGGDAISPDGDPMSEYVRRVTRDVSDRVTLVPSVRHDRLYPLVRHAAVVAIPSVIDNMPNTCLEAMALGQVVVATTGSCFEQLVTDRVSGFLVSPGDVTALSAGLAEALSVSPSGREQISRAAIARISRLAPEVIIPQVVEYYRSVSSAHAV
jgi:glycosyltransferase involved in cell wall biosynthesis